MTDYIQQLSNKALANDYFRQVVASGDNMQVVIMSLQPNEDIGMEVHEHNEQLLYCVQGKGRLIIDDTEAAFNSGDLALVRAGLRHNFINGGEEPMKIITVYSPPHHPEGTVQQLKADAGAY